MDTANNDKISVYNVGDRIYCDYSNKTGKIVALRDDSYERKERQKYPNRPFYYHIKFDDGSFDTYVSSDSIVKIWEA